MAAEGFLPAGEGDGGVDGGHGRSFTVKVGNAIVGNARVVLDAQRLAAEHGTAFDEKAVPMLTARKLD